MVQALTPLQEVMDVLVPTERGLGQLCAEAEQQVEQSLHAQAARLLLLQQELLQPLQPGLGRHPAQCESLYPGYSPTRAPLSSPRDPRRPGSDSCRVLPSPAERSLLAAPSSLAPGEHSRHFERSGCRCVAASPPVSVSSPRQEPFSLRAWTGP